MESSPEEVADHFYKNLEFATGRMRVLMGLGNNCINKCTLGKSTNGLANYLFICLSK
jgi:phosphoglucomutase